MRRNLVFRKRERERLLGQRKERERLLGQGKERGEKERLLGQEKSSEERERERETAGSGKGERGKGETAGSGEIVRGEREREERRGGRRGWMLSFVKCRGCGQAARACSCAGASPAKKARKGGSLGSLAGAMQPASKATGRPFLNKFKSAKLKPPWRAAHGGSVIFRVWDSVKQVQPSHAAVAAFDFDDCLVEGSIAFRNQTHRTPVEQRVMFQQIRPILRGLHDKGFRLVIFSNESLSRFKNPDPIQRAVDKKTSRIDEFLEFVDVPMEAYVACLKDKFRKPSEKDRAANIGGVGMWGFMCTDPNELGFSERNIQPQVSKSFYVGDAAGRSSDHSDCDKYFAKTVGVPFHLPENFFHGPKAVGAELSGTVDSSLVADEEQGSSFDPSVLAECLSKTHRQVVVVLSGLPGSGKSTTAKALLAQLPPGLGVRFSQDLLKSKQKVETAVRTALSNGIKLVLVDRTNISAEQRALWLDIASKAGAKSIVFQINLDLGQCVQRCQARSDHEGANFPTDFPRIKSIISNMNAGAQPPHAVEGMDHLVSANGCKSNLALQACLAQSIIHCVQDDVSSSVGAAGGLVNGPDSSARPLRRLCFSSLSTGDFKFDATTAANIILNVAERWLKTQPRCELCLVEPDNSNVAALLLTDDELSVRARMIERFTVKKGRVVEEGNAFAIAVGCADSLAKPGENLSNMHLHKWFRGDERTSIPQLVKDQFNVNDISTELGHVYALSLPDTKETSSGANWAWILMARGPNVNPDRPGCMNDASLAALALEKCYLTLFDTFGSKVAATSTAATPKVLSSSSPTSFPTYCSPPGPAPKVSGGHWRAALNVYCSASPPPEFERAVFFRNRDFCIIYDAYPKAQVHLLLMFIGKDGCSDVNEMAELTPKNLVCLETVLKWLNATLLPFLQQSTNAPIKCGFHAIPSMDRLHLHIVSQDFQSDRLKNKKHWISFTHKDYFIPLSRVVRELGSSWTPETFPKIKAKAGEIDSGLACHRCFKELPNMPKLKLHIASCAEPITTE